MRQAREIAALEQADVPAFVNQERADGDGLQNTSEFRADPLFSMIVGDVHFVSELDAIDAERQQNVKARGQKRKHSYSYDMGGGSLKLWQNSLNTTTLPGAVSALSIYGVLGIENAPSGGLEDEVEVKKRGDSSSCGGVGGADDVSCKKGRY